MNEIVKRNWSVYKHTAPNGKVYIGITSQKPEARWNKGVGYKKTYFYNAIQKYGWNNFKSEILFTGLTKEEADAKERDLIMNVYKSNLREVGYNIQNGGNSVGTHSAETRQKIATANKNRSWTNESRQKMSAVKTGLKASDSTKLKMSVARKGKKHNEETKEKLRLINIGKKLTVDTIEKIKLSRINKQWDYFKGKHHSEEFKKLKSRQMSEKYSGGNHPKAKIICQYDLNNNLIAEYPSLCIASEMLNFNKSSLSVACNNDKKYKNYLWKFKGAC